MTALFLNGKLESELRQDIRRQYADTLNTAGYNNKIERK